MGFKALIGLAAVSSLVATPAFAGVQALSLASQPVAAVSSAKDVRATTKSRKSDKLAGAGLGVGIAAAVAAGLGIAAAAGAFDDSDSK